MKSDIDKLYLIDRFLKGELSGPALDEFKNKMRLDKDFAKEVESKRAIIEGIKMARRQHLISIIKGEKKAVVPVVPDKMVEEPDKPIDISEYPPESDEEPEIKENTLSINHNNWYWAAAAVLFTLFTLYFIFGYYLPRHKGEYANSDTTRTELSVTNNDKTDFEKETEDSIDLAVNPFTHDTLKKIVIEQSDKNDVDSDSLKIEKDKKISETIYSVSALESIGSSSDGNNNQNASTGSHDSLKIQLTRKVKGTSIRVEYWQSVVNFKGYKLSGSDLQLFDLKPEEKVSLKFLDNILYMNKNGNYYKLKATGDFESYQKEVNPEILKKLDSK